MNENENMAEISFKGQHDNLPSTLEVNKEEENLNYNEEITLRGNEELEKVQIVENDAQFSKDLVAKEEDESTSSESHEKIKDEVVNTTPEMAPWGETYEELKNEEVTPIPKVEECII